MDVDDFSGHDVVNLVQLSDWQMCINLWFKWMQHVWKNLAEGSTHQTIYMPVFKKLEILLPPIGEQVLIAKAADHIEDNILAMESKLLNYRNLKKALMQDLLTGKVRVRVN